jgi:hypothetical protein
MPSGLSAPIWTNWFSDLSAELTPDERRRCEPLPGHDLPWEEWRWRNCPSATSSPMGEHHLRVWNWFDALVPGVKPDALIECWPRGHGKSTTVELCSTRMCVTAVRSFLLYVSCNQEAANRHVQAIGSAMEAVGVERSVNEYGYSRGWKANLLRTANGFNVLAFGLDAGARGVKLDFFRPDVIALDDVDELDDSVDRVEKKINTITQTILPAGTPDLAAIFVQNAITPISVMSRTLAGELDMLRRRVNAPIIKAVEGLKYEERDEDDSEGNPRRVWHITAGESTWAGKPIEVCEAEMNDFGLVAWLRECQQEVGIGGRLFPAFQEEKDGQPWHVCDPFDIPEHWYVWGSHDYGEGAPCCHLVYAADEEEGCHYVIGEHYEAGLTSSGQLDKALDLAERVGRGKPVDAERRDGRWKVRYGYVAFDHANTFPPENEEERRGEYPVEIWWRRGMRCVRAVKDRKAGWRRCNEVLTATRTITGPEGERIVVPKFRIFRGAAPNLVTAIAKARSDPKDPHELDPGFKNDHPLDSWRYGEMTRPPASGEDPTQPAEPDTRPTWMKKSQQQKKRKL